MYKAAREEASRARLTTVVDTELWVDHRHALEEAGVVLKRPRDVLVGEAACTSVLLGPPVVVVDNQRTADPRLLGLHKGGQHEQAEAVVLNQPAARALTVPRAVATWPGEGEWTLRWLEA